MRSAIVSLVCLSVASPALVAAQGAAIDHKKVACFVAGKHPRLASCFTPASLGAGSRVYFRPQDVEPWYYVEAKADALCQEGVLPKPSKKLVGKHVFYYVEAADRSSRTVENDAIVVRSAKECESDQLVAPSRDRAVVAVFPSLPPGFLTGGAIPTAVVIGGATAAAGAAALIATKDDDTPIAATTPPGPTTPPQTTPPTTTPGTAPLVLTCTADPRSGQAPLRVAFQAFPSGGTGVYGFSWRFGDGGTSNQVSPAYVYTTPGSFIARVDVTSGTQVAACERSILVTAPPPPPPPTTPAPGLFLLTTTLSGTGTGTVTSSPPGINCQPDCTETYTDGTVVTLTATPTGGSTFNGWSGGGCSGTGQCMVTMNAAQTVTAQFTAPPCNATLDVTKSGTGFGFVTSTPPGIACLGGGDCTETYPCGTPVTLRAAPSGGSTFVGWTGGACTGTGPCNLTMSANTIVDARFDLPSFTLTVHVLGTQGGSGVVRSSPAGIDCVSSPNPPGNTCTAPFAAATLVQLTGFPAGGSAPVSWSADCTGAPFGGACDLTMDQDHTADAQFNSGITRPQLQPSAIRWVSELKSARAGGQIVVNGGSLAAVREGRTEVQATAGEVNEVQAVITKAGEPGTWRFELPAGRIAPGSLQPLQGEVVLITADALVFRIQGKAGERLAFTFRLQRE